MINKLNKMFRNDKVDYKIKELDLAIKELQNI